MIIQLSSGQGPEECEIGVKLLFDSLSKEFGALKIISANKSRRSSGFLSVVFQTDCDLSFLEGTVEWQCKSFLRPQCKRKNWFLKVSVFPDEKEEIFGSLVEWQFFRSGGNGGQNVNKVESGVRLRHLQSGITVKSTEERTQTLNRKIALEKLRAELEKRQAEKMQGKKK